MNSQKIPQILSSFARVQQAEREKIINEIYDDFDNYLKELALPKDEDQLESETEAKME